MTVWGQLCVTAYFNTLSLSRFLSLSLPRRPTAPSWSSWWSCSTLVWRFYLFTFLFKDSNPSQSQPIYTQRAEESEYYDQPAAPPPLPPPHGPCWRVGGALPAFGLKVALPARHLLCSITWWRVVQVHSPKKWMRDVKAVWFTWLKGDNEFWTCTWMCFSFSHMIYFNGLM